MKTYYYYQAFRKTISQFLDLFNDIQVKRFDRNGKFLKFVKVPLKYSPKEKIWYWLNERKDDEQLPMMSVQLTSVEYSLERQTNKHRYIIDTVSPSAGALRSYLNPVPYDIQFSLNIWSLYMHDIDQILEQILPFFQPFVYMRVAIPELFSTYEAKVLFGSASPDFESEFADEGWRVLKYTLDFTVQTYLFKPLEDRGLIDKILVNFYTNENAWTTAFEDTTSTFSSGASGESMRIIGPSADDPDVWKYEIFQFGEKIGKTITFGD